MEIYKQFPELAEMSKEQIEAKYKAMKDAFITDAGFDITKITNQISDIDKLIQDMIQNWIDKAKEEGNKDEGSNNDDVDPIVTVVIPTEQPRGRGGGGGIIMQRGD